jgi:acetolactate synthase-1/2/3 large subunit
MEDADALLALGCRMGEMTTFGYAIPGPETRWAQVDAEPHGAALQNRPEIVMAADVAAFLRMTQRVLANAALDAANLDARRLRNAADREAFEAGSIVGQEPWDGPGVHPGRVVATLARILPPEAIVTTDAGDFGTWAARGYRFRRPGTFLGSTSGSMGFGLPAAIGAVLARPGRLGVALAGDGGFAMTMAELETAVRERAHVIALVFDNGRYGTIWRHQRLRGGPVGLATRLGAVNFAAVAEACGALGISVGSDEEFEPALRRALEAGRPAVLHLALDARWTTPDEDPMDVAAPSEEAEAIAAAELPVAVEQPPNELAEGPDEPREEAAPATDALEGAIAAPPPAQAEERAEEPFAEPIDEPAEEEADGTEDSAAASRLDAPTEEAPTTEPVSISTEGGSGA